MDISTHIVKGTAIGIFFIARRNKKIFPIPNTIYPNADARIFVFFGLVY